MDATLQLLPQVSGWTIIINVSWFSRQQVILVAVASRFLRSHKTHFKMGPD